MKNTAEMKTTLRSGEKKHHYQSLVFPLRLARVECEMILSITQKYILIVMLVLHIRKKYYQLKHAILLILIL